MKNSPIIRVKSTEEGVQLNIIANHVVSFCAKDNTLEVLVTGNIVYSVDCTERSFRSYMNKALGVSKKEDVEA